MKDDSEKQSSLDEGVLALLRDAFEDAPFEFWARDLAGRCIVANAETRALGGVDDGNAVEDAQVPPEVIASWQENNRRAYAGEVVQNSFEYGEGDKKRYLQCYIVPLRLAGEIKGVLGFNIDVTRHRRTEEALRLSELRLRDFLGVLSHELRTPLSVIGSAVHCIDHAALPDEQVRRAVSVIDRQARHLSRLVDDLLDITRVRSGKIDLQRTSVDLVQLVRNTVEEHREILAGHHVTLRLPDARASTNGDATRLAQVLSNLLSNAAKFTPAGGAITVSLAVEQGRATLDVADSGVGIDAESLAQLFVPFVQADRSIDRSRQGLGLGLALAKTLVELHGGEVRAYSAGPGQGACFSITLPLVEAEPIETRPTPSAKASPRNVLIIEDDVDAAEWLSIALSFHGHQITIALDGAAGITKARELRPDVILCDIGLPGGLDGYAVARALLGDAALASSYRVALSGYTQAEDQAKARAAGFDAHLSKPPDVAALAHLLAELPKR